MSPRVVLVTGASSGLGRAGADLLSGRGWTVVGASRRGTGGASWEGIVMDVDADGAVSAGVRQVVERHGRLDAVVAAAGWGLAGPIEETSIDEAKAQVETNLWGAARVVRAALPHVREAKGRVVLVGSLAGLIAIPYQAYYSVSKFALEAYAEALSYEVAPFGVGVTIVEPGNFNTGFTDARRDVALAPDSPYAAATDKAVGRMEKDERGGADPNVCARTIVRVLEARRPPLRVTTGRACERLGPIAKRLLPFRAFAAAARSSLGA
ncbi:MAG TPA: SDR family oxidoreductase [Acidimicrobiales bacterium]|nr:SDR family oxidoreductase [Acidimicrobiales bacterium]